MTEPFAHLGVQTMCIPSDRVPPEFLDLTLRTADIRPRCPDFSNPEARRNRDSPLKKRATPKKAAPLGPRGIVVVSRIIPRCASLTISGF